MDNMSCCTRKIKTFLRMSEATRLLRQGQDSDPTAEGSNAFIKCVPVTHSSPNLYDLNTYWFVFDFCGYISAC